MAFLKLTKKQWKQFLLHFFITVPIGLFVLVSSVLFIYIFWPLNYESVKYDLPIHSQKLFVISHGLKDTPNSWARPLAIKLNKQFPDSKAIVVDWSEYATDAFNCSVSAKRIGKRIGESIASLNGLHTVHLIGHSCGAFINLGACEAIKNDKNDLKIQTTYLDPVSVYGGMFWRYGVDRFGRCGDFSDTYIDTEDNVPGSNKALPNSYTFDVTPLRTQMKEDIHPHLWPIAFYQSHVLDSNFLTINKNFPRLNCRLGSLIDIRTAANQCLIKE